MPRPLGRGIRQWCCLTSDDVCRVHREYSWRPQLLEAGRCRPGVRRVWAGAGPQRAGAGVYRGGPPPTACWDWWYCLLFLTEITRLLALATGRCSSHKKYYDTLAVTLVTECQFLIFTEVSKFGEKIVSLNMKLIKNLYFYFLLVTVILCYCSVSLTLLPSLSTSVKWLSRLRVSEKACAVDSELCLLLSLLCTLCYRLATRRLACCTLQRLFNDGDKTLQSVFVILLFYYDLCNV